MKRSVFLGAVAMSAMLAGHARAGTLDDVKERDMLICGVNTGLVGFASQDAAGNWQGFDVAICKAVAAAVLGDATKVTYVPTSSETRFDDLADGKVDLLARNTTGTFHTDVGTKVDFAGVNYYDGQGFMVRKGLGISSAKELNGMTVCVQGGTTTALNLEDYFQVNNMTLKEVPVTSSSDGEQKYLAGDCDAYTTDASGLAATRAVFADPENHILLPEIISKEPLGPVVREGDDQWADVVRWTLNALIAAEEYGVTSANIEELVKSGSNPEISRLLGVSGELGAELGLDNSWARNAIAASGNYGEIFAATIGESTPVGLPRGLNAQWTQGGLLYSPPFR